MINEHIDAVASLLPSLLTERQAKRMSAVLEPMIDASDQGYGCVTRAQFAAAMNTALFSDLLDRVPTGNAYVEDVERAGRRVTFDHGAIRTVCLSDGATGASPRGELAFRRILEPLGYEMAAIYPLPKLRMTGRAYRHRDHPDSIPQFFVSELHVDQFDAEFAAAADRVFGTSRDPLDEATVAVLRRFASGEAVDLADACAALPVIVGAFGRHHDRPMRADYALLAQHSGEAAWIATEGNAFNHATDRVPDVVALAAAQRAIGRPIKQQMEVSATGRVRQTAFRADMVERVFGMPDGPDQVMPVAGSFYEFISRDPDPATGRLDLSFDSSNATGIFTMTGSA